MGRPLRAPSRSLCWRHAAVLGCGVLLACAMSGAGTPAVASLCGNGIVDAGEQCDDGAANGNDRCCSVTCERVDADHDGWCDALDPCTNLVPVRIEAPRLVLTDRTATAGDLTFALRGEVVVPPVPPIDPASKGIRLVMRQNFYNLPLDVTVPGGQGWKGTGGAWNYHDAAGTNGGVTRVVLRQVGATPGALAFVVEGRHVALGDLRYVLPVKLSLVVDSPTASTGQCGETWVRQALCKLDRSGRTLRCGALPHLFPCRSSRPDALVRCDLGQAVVGQEAYWTTHFSYYTGACAGLPGVIPSPYVVCNTAGTSGSFVITSTHPSANEACTWDTRLVAGRPPFTCTRSSR